ncbi:MAG TPA: efflux RND transporter periplasmic adaptor subunit [Oxalobacteraceae bacterium]|nr:efflux RND transporter periplasmic adaptor subunit [Oxalobacteraceae bacterium]
MHSHLLQSARDREAGHLLAVLVAATLAVGFLKKRNDASTTAAVASSSSAAAPVLEFLPGDITRVQPHDLKQTLSLSGSLRALNQAIVKSRIAGEIVEVLVREGETVKAGQVVAKMDTREYQARYEQANGALLAARGQLEIATKARDNNKALLGRGFISQNAFDNAASQFEIARANVESAQAALELTRKILGDTIIRAPISGVVSSRTVQPGERVPIDSRLLDVVDLSKMEMETGVPAGDIVNVSLGQEVVTRIEGVAAPVVGKVVRINPSTQSGSRSVLIYVQIENPDARLKAGMFGEAQLTLQKKSGVLTVPQSAVQTSNGKATIYAIENGILTQRPVKLGMKGLDNDGPAVEVLEGLTEGMQIVRTNLGNMATGTRVRLMPAKE